MVDVDFSPRPTLSTTLACPLRACSAREQADANRRWRGGERSAGSVRGAVSGGLPAPEWCPQLRALPVAAGFGAAAQERRADGGSGARDDAGAIAAVSGRLPLGGR